MQLLYLWIKEFNSLKQVGFNFNSKYKFEYNHNDRTIICSHNNNFIEGFFKKDKNKNGVEDLTLIIGNNGSGKTSIFQYISYVFNIINNSIQGIFIFLDNNKIKIYYNILEKNDGSYLNLNTDLDLDNYFANSNRKIKGLKDTRNLYKIQNTNANELINDLRNTHFIFYSDIFSYQYLDIKSYNRFHNISTMGLIRSDMKNKIENNIIDKNKDKNLNFFHDEFFRQMEFVCNYEENNILPFKLTAYCNVRFLDLKSIIDEICKMIDEKYSYDMKKEYINNNKNIENKLLGNILEVNKIINDKIQNIYNLGIIISNENQINILDFKIRLINGIFTEILYNVIPRTGGKNNEIKYKHINCYIESEILNKINSQINISDLFNFLINFCESIRSNLEKTLLPIASTQIDNYIKSIKWFKDNIDSKFIEDIHYNSLDITFKLKVFKNNNKENNCEINNLKIFFEKYILSAKVFNYLEFSWPLSSGQNTFLSMFARFYSLISNKKFEISKYEKAKDIIILIDEGDITLHPEWQQKYVQSLLWYLQDIFKDYNLQLIITTHSPILLSDIPSNNVLYIRKDQDGLLKLEKENPKMFASNIYDIYRKGFYLNKSNFGIIGEFALNKIKKIEDILKEISDKDNHYSIGDAKTKLEYCRETINIIGEEFIKGLLQAKYDKVLNMLYKKTKEKSNSKRLDELKNDFEKLSNGDQKALIKYIIQRNENN